MGKERYFLCDPENGEQEFLPWELMELLEQGKISVDAPVREKNEPEFQPLKEHPDFAASVSASQRANWRELLGERIMLFLLPVLVFLFVFFLRKLWYLQGFAALFLFPWLAGGCRTSNVLSQIQTAAPYWNLIAGPLLMAGRCSGAERFFRFAGWVSYGLLIASFWFLSLLSPGAEWIVLSILMMMLLSVCGVFGCRIRAGRKTMRQVRIAAGFGERPRMTFNVKNWMAYCGFLIVLCGIIVLIAVGADRFVYSFSTILLLSACGLCCYTICSGRKKMLQVSVAAVQWWELDRVCSRWRVILLAPLIWIVLPIAVYLAVIYGVGVIRLPFAERAVTTAGLPLKTPPQIPESSSPELLVFYERVGKISFTDPPEQLGELTHWWWNRFRHVDPRYWEALEAYVAANRSVLEEFQKLCADLPENPIVGRKERNTETPIKQARELMDGDLLLREHRGEFPTPEELALREKLSRSGWYFYVDRMRYLPVMPEPYLRSRILFLEAEEQVAAEEAVKECWRFYADGERGHELPLQYLMMEWKLDFLWEPLWKAKSYYMGLDEYPLTQREYYQVKEEWKRKLRWRDPRNIPLSLSIRLACLRIEQCCTALELYRRKHGDYPDTLNRLAPEFLAEIPLDPFSGEALRYSKREVWEEVCDIGWNLGWTELGYDVEIPKSAYGSRKSYGRVSLPGACVHSVGRNGRDDSSPEKYDREDDIAIAITPFVSLLQKE